MPDQCMPDDIEQVKAILEAVHELNQGENRSELLGKIKRCASKTGLSAQVLTSSLGKISGITPDDISLIVAAIPTPQQPATAAVEFNINDRVKINKSDHYYYNKQGIITKILPNGDLIEIQLDNINVKPYVKREFLEKISTSDGGKRKSKKNISKKSKSKKRHSKRRKHRKMRRTRR